MVVLRYAGLWPRAAALALDFAALSAVFFPITRLVKGVWLMTPADHLWREGWFIFDPLCAAFLGAIAAYFVVAEGAAGRTLGKWALGLKVVGPTGGRPGLPRAALRNLLRLVDGLPTLSILGVVLILVTAERTRVGDLAAGTRVVHAR